MLTPRSFWRLRREVGRAAPQARRVGRGALSGVRVRHTHSAPARGDNPRPRLPHAHRNDQGVATCSVRKSHVPVRAAIESDGAVLLIAC